MKVKKLISILSERDPEKEVLIAFDGLSCIVAKVDSYEEGAWDGESIRDDIDANDSTKQVVILWATAPTTPDANQA